MNRGAIANLHNSLLEAGKLEVGRLKVKEKEKEKLKEKEKADIVPASKKGKEKERVQVRIRKKKDQGKITKVNLPVGNSRQVGSRRAEKARNVKT